MQRAALRNRDLAALAGGHVLGIIADKAMYIAVLVYVFNEAGAAATATASIVIVAPLVMMTPVVARILSGNRPSRARTVTLWSQALFTGAVAAAVALDAPAAVATAAATAATAATTMQRPAVAVLSPGLSRSPDELIAFNVWMAYASSITAVAAPLVATVGLGIGGELPVLIASTVLVTTSAIVSLGLHRLELNDQRMNGARSDATRSGVAAAAREIGSRPGAWAIISAATMHYSIVAALPVLTIVLAKEVYDLGPEGPGTLNVLAGIGALIAGVVASSLLLRRSLARVILAMLVTVAIAHATLAASDDIVFAYLMIPAIGGARVILDGVSRLMLQRATSPEVLGGVFALLQAATGVGGLLGTGLVQVLLLIGDVETALIGVAVWFLVTAAALAVPLLRADRQAHVPVVEMSLLRRIDLLSPIPPTQLEALARAAEHTDREAGSVIVAEGDEGDLYYAIAHGVCLVAVDGHVVDELQRGDGFGEIALLIDCPRTATVIAETDVDLLAIHRSAFLTAVTGSAEAQRSAWAVLRGFGHAEDRSPFDD